MANDNPERSSCPHLPTHVARELSVIADVDPRTIHRAYARRRVKGAAGRRAIAVLTARGYLPQGGAAA